MLCRALKSIVICYSTNRKLIHYIRNEATGPVDPGLLGKETDGCRYELRTVGGVWVGGRAGEHTWDAAPNGAVST